MTNSGPQTLFVSQDSSSVCCFVFKVFNQTILEVGQVTTGSKRFFEDSVLIVFAFITGSISSEPLLEGLLSQVQIDLSFQVSAGIESETYGQQFFSQVPRSIQLK